MTSKYLNCDIELVKFKDNNIPTKLIFNDNDSGPGFLFYEDNPGIISYGFCDLVVKYKDNVIGTLSNGELSEELVKSYINFFNIRDTMKTVEIKFDVDMGFANDIFPLIDSFDDEIKHLLDDNGKLVYRIVKEKKYTREEFVKAARWAFHFYKNDQSLSDEELEQKFEELLLDK